MDIIQMKLTDDLTYDFIDKIQMPPPGSIILFKFNLDSEKLDIETVAQIAEKVYGLFQQVGVEVLFIPDILAIDSINDCEQIIENLSKKLYEFSELQGKLLEERKQYESF